MSDKKQVKLIEKTQYYFTFILIYLFFAAIFFTASSFYRFNQTFAYTTYLAALLLTGFACFNPLSFVLLGHAAHKMQDDQRSKLLEVIEKTPNLKESAISMLVVNDSQSNVFLISQPSRNHIVCTSAALEKFNIIDFEAIFAYFAAKKEAKPEFIDTIYLLIATLIEKAIIVKPLANVFASMTVTYGERYIFDKKAVETTKNPIGYKNMLIKAKEGCIGSRLGKSFSIVGVFDTGSNDALEMVDEIDKRINSVAKA